MTTLDDADLNYHEFPRPGKLEIKPTKNLSNQRDLALAYSPGVAAPCRAIVEDEEAIFRYTNRRNLVAVISNGTAVLGLGNIGPKAAKPVMEGKAVLFKKFANIDCFDIEVDEQDPGKLIDIVASLAPTFGGINLEDIKAPDCFLVEKALAARLDIPVFHDDQHGTAIIVAAALVNAIQVAGKSLETVKLTTSGGGAAALACLDMLIKLGLPRDNIIVTDLYGVVYRGREEGMNPFLSQFASGTSARTLQEALVGVDIFLGLSAPNVLKPEWLKGMNPNPIVFALANPDPEILPELTKAARPDAIIATGRSDYPNQVNNVLCFPYIFRGALDVGATCINDAMKIACVKAIADLAKAEPSEVVARAYNSAESMIFGREYLIPKPFDPRLYVHITAAVAQAAMDSGVAKRPLSDVKAYIQGLNQFVIRSGLLMRPVFERARGSGKKIVFAEGDDDRVLRAGQILVDEGLARPVFIGDPAMIGARLEQLGLKINIGAHCDVIDPAHNPDYAHHWRMYHHITARHGVSPDKAQFIVGTDTTVLAALLVKGGQADAMLCGIRGSYQESLKHINRVIGLKPGVKRCSALSILILPRGVYFFSDTYVNPDPTAEDLVDMIFLGADQIRRFGLEPKVALLSHSNFGSSKLPSAKKMARVRELLLARDPAFPVEGEMHADAALDTTVRDRIFPDSAFAGEANFLVMPSLDAANIAYTMTKALGEGLPIGPLLLGVDRPAYVATPSITARGLVNMAAIAVVDAEG
ncbi:MAG: NADP-dependent malic enzyme [Alphaproteobacteria bacterium]